ncbi:hypothetical protein HMPREF2533_00013 [Bacteroides fragilis]|nr:hypothetical protein HMPREF2530_00013 [Bacteroides fragilis]KXU51496.1 hypothetical protein HMPREF2533_00013 [Bacteroides fragilis]
MFHFYRAKIRILFTTLIFYAIKTFSVTSLIHRYSGYYYNRTIPVGLQRWLLLFFNGSCHLCSRLAFLSAKA